MSEEETKTPQQTYDWDDMLSKSDYSTLLFIQKLLHSGEINAAIEGVDKLVDFQTKSEKMDLEYALTQLMQYIILWKEDSKYRTGETVEAIHDAQDNVDFYLEEGTELNNNFLKEIWQDAFERAKKFAQIELQASVNLTSLTWKEVFEDEYSMFDVISEV